MKNLKEYKGITLIALVITIVVLLVLSAITIKAFSNNEIIEKAKIAKANSQVASEKEKIKLAVMSAQIKNEGELTQTNFEEELDKEFGEDGYSIKYYSEDDKYEITITETGNIHEVSRDGKDISYLGNYEELKSDIQISVTPEENETPKLIQEAEVKIKTGLSLESKDITMLYAWNQTKEEEPTATEYKKITTIEGTKREKNVTVYSDVTAEGDYYLWLKITINNETITNSYGEYKIKDHTTLVSTSSENNSTSKFLGLNVQRNLIKEVNILNTKTHEVDNENYFDITASKNEKYVGSYYQDTDGYYVVTLEGQGGLVANTNSSYLFACIGYGVTETNIEVKINGLEYLDTGLTTNMLCMFRSSKLLKLNLNNLDTNNVISMGYIFNGCSKLTELSLSKIDIQNVSTTQCMFEGCSNLTNLDLSSFNTSKVKSMSSMFRNCSNLKKLNINNWNTINVTDMNQIFSGCTLLENLDLNNLNTENVTNMSHMFRGCSNLISLDVSKLNTSKSTSLAALFNGCSKISNLDISNFNTATVKDMQYLFGGCSSLTQLDASKFETSNVTNMGNMFFGCSKLTSLDINSFDTSNVTNMSFLFSNCSQLTNLDLSNFDTRKVTNMSNMFDQCLNLTSLDLSNFNTKNVINMTRMFQRCSGFKNLNLSSFDTSNVTNMLGMFYSCSNLTSLDLSKFNTSNVTNMYGMYGMFENCTNLTSLDLSNFDTTNVTNMFRMFYGCSKINTEITIRNSGTTTYTNMFSGAATASGAQIKVNYTSETSDLVDNMIATKSNTSNVIKGNLVTN